VGLFSRSTPTDTPSATRPIAVALTDLSDFSSRLAAVEQGVGGPDAPLREAIQALSESAGGVNPRDLMKFDDPVREIDRPWRWFAKACEVANEHGDHDLAPRVFLFTLWWKSMEGKLGVADYQDMWLDQVRPDAYQAISQAAAHAIAQLPDDYKVLQTPRGEVFTAGSLRSTVQTAISSAP
jgi:hypothetical protein